MDLDSNYLGLYPQLSTVARIPTSSNRVMINLIYITISCTYRNLNLIDFNDLVYGVEYGSIILNISELNGVPQFILDDVEQPHHIDLVVLIEC